MSVATFCSICLSKNAIPHHCHMRDDRETCFESDDTTFWGSACQNSVTSFIKNNFFWSVFPYIFHYYALWQFLFCIGDSCQILTDYCYELSDPIQTRETMACFVFIFIVTTNSLAGQRSWPNLQERVKGKEC